MTKPSKEKFINQPENPAKSITEQVKKLRDKPQTEKTREEIRRLIREYFNRFGNK